MDVHLWGSQLEVPPVELRSAVPTERALDWRQERVAAQPAAVVERTERQPGLLEAVVRVSAAEETSLQRREKPWPPLLQLGQELALHRKETTQLELAPERVLKVEAQGQELAAQQTLLLGQQQHPMAQVLAQLEQT